MTIKYQVDYSADSRGYSWFAEAAVNGEGSNNSTTTSLQIGNNRVFMFT